MPDPPHREFLQCRLINPLLGLLSLGAAIGPVPVLRISTGLCALAAVFLRLNMPAIQLVHYLLAPLQLILMVRQLRFGELPLNAPRFPLTLDAGLELLSPGAIAH